MLTDSSSILLSNPQILWFTCWFYLNSAFVTGYLSILKGFTLTSLMGDSPSFPSAALVPINIFPPGMFTISSAAGRQEGTCFYTLKQSRNLSIQCWWTWKVGISYPSLPPSTQYISGKPVQRSFSTSYFTPTLTKYDREIWLCALLKEEHFKPRDSHSAKLISVSVRHIFSLQRK